VDDDEEPVGAVGFGLGFVGLDVDATGVEDLGG